MNEIKRRITKIEKKIPKPEKRETWLMVQFRLRDTQEQREAARCAAIKEWEQQNGHELNTDEICWIEYTIYPPASELTEEERRALDKHKYPYISWK